MPYKTFVLGLDGATFDLLKPWAYQGHLPTMKRLMEGGAWGELRSTVPPMTPSAWTSFFTGKNPGKHGLYDWIYRHPDSYNVSPLSAEHIVEPTLWSLLGQAGHRLCIINVPMTYPPKPVNGLLISGMPAPSTKVPITYPETLLSEVESAVGEYLVYPDPGQAYSDAGVDAFLRRLYDTTERRLQVLDLLRAREDWHFLMLVLNGTDTVQHATWKYMSSLHPLHDPSRAAKYGDAILDYYRYVDQALGQIVDGLDDETVLVVMSDHGFGPFHKFVHVNNWLRQHGWLKLKRTPLAVLKAAVFDLGFSPMVVYDLLMRIGLGRLKREVVRGKGQNLLKTLFLSFDEVDWSQTLAYSLGNVGQIYINVKGREPQGVVAPGAEYEAVRDELIERLTDLRDPRTGQRIAQDIYRREEIYSGPALERAADIVFIPCRGYFGFGEYEFGSNQVIEAVRRGISGTHRMNGILVLYGEPIRAGALASEASLFDLAPTILHLMGVPVPTDMDGRVLTDVLHPPLADPASVRYAAVDDADGRHPADTEPPNGHAQSDDAGLSDEDKQTIIERLRSLGYVG